MSTIWDCPIFIVCSSHLPCVLPTNSKIFCAAFYQKSCILSAPKKLEAQKKPRSTARLSQGRQRWELIFSAFQIADALPLHKGAAHQYPGSVEMVVLDHLHQPPNRSPADIPAIYFNRR